MFRLFRIGFQQGRRQTMRLVVNGPAPGSEEERRLALKIAEIHSQAAAEIIGDLNCPAEQKKALLHTALGRNNR